MLDLRIPSGLFFAIVGLILCGLGIFSGVRAALTDVNVNLYSGLVMLSFGALLLGPGAEKRVTRAFRAPGRVNLIGEHTDYNLGFVLPIALDLGCVATATPATDGRLRVYTEDLNQSRDWDPGRSAHLSPAHDWTDYVIGVARELIRAGYEVGPQSLRIHSTVPIGSGLSSSAALEVSAALAMLDGRPIEPLRLAQLCQRAEREFVGVPSGIMDQYVAVFGQEGSAIEIDCRSLTHKVVTLPPGKWKLSPSIPW